MSDRKSASGPELDSVINQLEGAGAPQPTEPPSFTELCSKCNHPIVSHSPSNGCTHYIEKYKAECGCDYPTRAAASQAALTQKLAECEDNYAIVAKYVDDIKKQIGLPYNCVIGFTLDKFEEKIRVEERSVRAALIEKLEGLAMQWKEDAQILRKRDGDNPTTELAATLFDQHAKELTEALRSTPTSTGGKG